jgi:hypothetical protein
MISYERPVRAELPATAETSKPRIVKSNRKTTKRDNAKYKNKKPVGVKLAVKVDEETLTSVHDDVPITPETYHKMPATIDYGVPIPVVTSKYKFRVCSKAKRVRPKRDIVKERKLRKKAKKEAAKKAAAALKANANCESASFLGLPGEIRNHIYELAFDDRRVLIKRGNPPGCKKGPGKKLLHEILPFLDRFEVKKPQPIPLGVMFSCKKIYQETTTMLYAKTNFVFASIKALRFFLAKAAIPGKESIRNIEINHEQYGTLMRERKDLWCKERFDYHFYLECEKAANDFKALKELKVDLWVKDYPAELNLEADWAAPFLLFAGKGLVKTEATLKVTSMNRDGKHFDDKLVDAYAKIFARELLGEKGKKAWCDADDKRRALEVIHRRQKRLAAKSALKVKILNIVST